MYCSTCGAAVPTGRRACDTCGTPQVSRVRSSYQGGPQLLAPAQPAFAACPRCAYRGEGVGYFSRGSRMAALVGVTMLSAGVMGAGGLIYYLLRKDHQVCPRCGLSWGSMGTRALARPAAAGVPAAPTEALVHSGGREAPKRVGSVMLLVFAVMLMVGGVAGMEMVPLLMGVLAGAGGFALRRSADRDREARRAELIATLQKPVLQLAAERGGALTVTEVAAHLGWTLPRAEKVLHSLDDGLRVDSEVTDEGLIVYNFLELRHGGDAAPPSPRLPGPDA